MLIVETVRCRFCGGKMELAGEGFVLLCHRCRKGTRLPKATSLSKITQGKIVRELRAENGVQGRKRPQDARGPTRKG